MSEALELSNLSRSFGATTVLAGIDLSLAAGERLAVVGPSGSGKTTLLRLIAGLDVPTTGSVTIASKIVSQAGELLVPPERRSVAMVFQGLALFPHLRALDQIAFAARGRGGRERAKQLLDRVGLGHRATAPLDRMSGGERQRIALARALAQEPALILMDEPFASLDDQRRAEMRNLLRSLLDETDATFILVTHSRDDALSLADRVLILDGGRPVVSDTLANVLAKPKHSAAVRSLGLGQIIEGETRDGQTAQTSFGNVSLSQRTAIGRVQVLIRPAQPRISASGVEAEVISIELHPPISSERIQQIAIVRVDRQVLRVEVQDQPVTVGQSIRVCIDGACLALMG